jgi:SAM-dependent methyltransferase
MAIGSSLYCLHQSKAMQLMVRIFGVEEFHSHLRVAPLKRLFQTLIFDQPIPQVLEIGCGSGLNLFELSTVAKMSGTGVDVDESAIAIANQARYKLGYDHLSFYCSDVRYYKPTSEVDCLLLMDILEHLPNPAEVLNQLGRYLKKGGYAIVSVPTPLYPRVFGRRFHNEIGHIVDGYWLDDLQQIMPETFGLVRHQYHTGLLTWPACFLYYRYFRNIQNRLVRLAMETLLVPFRWLDIIKGKYTSASLFALYRKLV